MEEVRSELRSLAEANARLFAQLGEANKDRIRLEALLKHPAHSPAKALQPSNAANLKDSSELSAALRNLAHRDAHIASLSAELGFLARQNQDLQAQLRRAAKASASSTAGAKASGGSKASSVGSGDLAAKNQELRRKNVALLEALRAAEAAVGK